MFWFLSFKALNGVYQLWPPWTPLDESFQWLWHTTPTPSSKHPFRASPCFPHTPSELEVQLCFQEVTLVVDTPFLEPGVSPKLPCHTSELRTMNKKGLVRKPQPVHLSGVDSVFGRSSQLSHQSGLAPSEFQTSQPFVKSSARSTSGPLDWRNLRFRWQWPCANRCCAQSSCYIQHTRSAPLSYCTPSKGSPSDSHFSYHALCCVPEAYRNLSKINPAILLFCQALTIQDPLSSLPLQKRVRDWARKNFSFVKLNHHLKDNQTSIDMYMREPLNKPYKPMSLVWTHLNI